MPESRRLSHYLCILVIILSEIDGIDQSGMNGSVEP
jgi:hypothetical protein